jgi:hypothetical protein
MGDLTVNGSVKVNPDFDSGWFFVTDGSGNVQVTHALGKVPSHFVVQQCGALKGYSTPPNPLPTVAAPLKNVDCQTRVVVTSTAGYKEPSQSGFGRPSGVNPGGISVSDTDIWIPLGPGWWVWGYPVYGVGWECTGDDDNNCFTGYYRILAWR